MVLLLLCHSGCEERHKYAAQLAMCLYRNNGQPEYPSKMSSRRVLLMHMFIGCRAADLEAAAESAHLWLAAQIQQRGASGEFWTLGWPGSTSARTG